MRPAKPKLASKMGSKAARGGRTIRRIKKKRPKEVNQDASVGRKA